MTGTAVTPPERFTLELPPDPAYVSAARLFAATVARQVGVAEDLLDDIKMAVGEACARALATAANRPLSVEVERSDGRVVFEVAQGKPSSAIPSHLTSTPTQHIGPRLAQGASQDADIVEGRGGTAVVRFSVPEL